MDRHYVRRGCRGEIGGDEEEPRRNLVRLERIDQEGQCRLLPHSGSDGLYRIRSSTHGRRLVQPYPYDLPRPNERLRPVICQEMNSLPRNETATRSCRDCLAPWHNVRL